MSVDNYFTSPLDHTNRNTRCSLTRLGQLDRLPSLRSLWEGMGLRGMAQVAQPLQPGL